MICSTLTNCTASPNIVTREIEGELIIVPLVSGIGDAGDELYTLNETGRAIWRLLDGRRTLGAIATELAEEFEAPDDAIAADVLGFIEEMVRRQLVVVGDQPSAGAP